MAVLCLKISHKKTLLHKLGCAASINIWKDSVTYDELTINERQKSDAEFADILDCVRRGCPTDKIYATLQQRVIQGSITDKFEALCRVGQTPLCLFPTRNLCKQFNHEMLEKIGTELHKLVCVWTRSTKPRPPESGQKKQQSS